MSAWIDFVKKVQKRDGSTYSAALKKASKEYKKGSSTTSKTATKKKAPAKKKASSKSKKDMEMKE